ncbi:hypothetical protein RHMOL_Rhmol03G0097200 [Rhododendron molle]|uniref:Uncharacterized protein n=1 Tax=Rhododendron molle TaxID=49168 RepID=A0ACC0PDM8_RHOML|nr:hypothetical protein RHMOL_Rhmol03G0097200 [Rhododendron molle]
MFCCKNPNSVETADSLKNPDPKGPEPDLESGTKGIGEEETVELEFKRLHNRCTKGFSSQSKKKLRRTWSRMMGNRDEEREAGKGFSLSSIAGEWRLLE